MTVLPAHNELGYFEIRLESIGGLGANLAGKMLAEAGVIGQGLNGIHFSSYGSEKKGTPVKSYIRFAEPDTDIFDHSPIEKPHVIAIFHESLHRTVPVTEGLAENGIVLVNTARSFEEVQRDLKIPRGTLALVDALNISIETKARLNTAMLGALYRVLGFLDPESMRSVIRKTFEKKGQELVEANLKSFERGYEEVRVMKVNSPSIYSGEMAIAHSFGYKTQPPGGIIRAVGNTIQRDMSACRLGFIPALNLEACIHCAQCDLVCPDFCFVWEEGTDKRGKPQMFLRGIDYQYCKGCLKCVNICPTEALSKRRETPEYIQQHRVKHSFPLIEMEVTNT